MSTNIPQPEEGEHDDEYPDTATLRALTGLPFMDTNPEPLDMLFDADGHPFIIFDPVPMQRRRKHGWDAARQQAFICILARVPSVGRAAKAVGMSARSAYRLLDKPGAEQFAKAWDMALDHGMSRLRGETIARAMEGGDFVPVYRRGRLVRVEWRRNDKLALSLLAAKDRDVDHYRRSAQVRWRQKQEWDAFDKEDAPNRPLTPKRQAELEARFIRRCEEFIAANPPPPKEPKIRML